MQRFDEKWVNCISVWNKKTHSLDMGFYVDTGVDGRLFFFFSYQLIDPTPSIPNTTIDGFLIP